MDKNIVKIIGLVLGLILLVGALVYLLISGINVGPLNAVSVSGIADKSEDVENAKLDLEKAETGYDSIIQTLETAKKEFNNQKKAYELITDEKIKAVKEATKEEEYLIEYLWITLGNYATKHDLEVAIVEPGGNTGNPESTGEAAGTDVTDVSTGTGVTGDSTGVTNNTPTQTTPATNTNSANNKDGEEGDQTEPAITITTGLTSSADALTVQVKGSYIDLADFVFEVENDKSLRFRLDNIRMSSAGGTQVIASFNVKDFTVLKSLETNNPQDLLQLEY